MSNGKENEKVKRSRGLSRLFSSESTLTKVKTDEEGRSPLDKFFLRRRLSKASLSAQSSDGSQASLKRPSTPRQHSYANQIGNTNASVQRLHSGSMGLNFDTLVNLVQGRSDNVDSITDLSIRTGESNARSSNTDYNSGKEQPLSAMIADEKHTDKKYNRSNDKQAQRLKENMYLPPPQNSPSQKGSPSSDSKSHHPHLSHLSLKRFLKKLKHSDNHKVNHFVKPENLLPTHSESSLYRKYTVGKLLGTGASGSVNLVTLRNDPNSILAVKKFRQRFHGETETDYKAKVKNEFKIGEVLKHQNLVNIIELIKDSNSMLSDPDYYIVMEYCPYDFFNLVMSGLMTADECNCYFKQIINGVNHLHLHGLAHRDLKLDNCIVNKDGILKLIDFGSAVNFRKEKRLKPLREEESSAVLLRARGIVGSDPYLAPELFEKSNFGYDPRPVDIWSIAIIYCCTILKRFPWKIPQVSDPSFKIFAECEREEDVKNFTDQMESDLKLSSESSQDIQQDKQVHQRRHHHNRVIRLLPPASRELISSMLIINPEKRISMEAILKSDFYLEVDYCHYIDNDNRQLVAAKNHKHHLVTESDLEELNKEKQRQKRLQEAGVA